MNLRLRSITSVLYACILFFAISGQANAVTTKININTADVKQLTQLKYIGVKVAKRIVEHREANGIFETPEDILKVKGIGKKIYEVNRELIVVSDEVATGQE